MQAKEAAEQMFRGHSHLEVGRVSEMVCLLAQGELLM